MHRHVTRLVTIATIQFLALSMTSAAVALTKSELRCQSGIGAAGRTFVAAKLKAIVACNEGEIPRME